MKFWPFAVLCALVTLGAINVQAAEIEGSASLGIFDKYLWRGFDLSEGRGVVQGAVEASANGFTLGVWANAQLRDSPAYDAGEVSEVDLTIDYTFELGETASVSLGNITYILKDLDDTNEAYLGVTVDTLLSPALTVYYDWDEADEHGLYYTAGVSHSFEPCTHATANLGALVGYNDESDYSVGNYSGWHNYELTASVDLTIGDLLTVTPSLAYSSPLSERAQRAIDSEWLAGITLSGSFGN